MVVTGIGVDERMKLPSKATVAEWTDTATPRLCSPRVVNVLFRSI